METWDSCTSSASIPHVNRSENSTAQKNPEPGQSQVHRSMSSKKKRFSRKSMVLGNPP